MKFPCIQVRVDFSICLYLFFFVLLAKKGCLSLFVVLALFSSSGRYLIKTRSLSAEYDRNHLILVPSPMLERNFHNSKVFLLMRGHRYTVWCGFFTSITLRGFQGLRKVELNTFLDSCTNIVCNMRRITEINFNCFPEFLKFVDSSHFAIISLLAFSTNLVTFYIYLSFVDSSFCMNSL